LAQLDTTHTRLFEDVITRRNPRGYVRSLLAVSQNLNSAAEVDAAYQKFVAANNEAAVLEAAKTLAAEKPHPGYAGDLDLLTRVLNSSRSVDSPAGPAMIDNPEYLAWKGFSVGAKSSYLLRVLVPARPGSDQLNPGQALVRFTHAFRSIDARQMNLWKTEIYYDSVGGAPHPPRDTEWGYPAKIPVSAAPSNAQSGEEELRIGGRVFHTRWRSTPSNGRGCNIAAKTWTSDEVPGGLVRKVEPGNNCTAQETILESFEGGGPNGNGRFTASASSVAPAPVAVQPTQPAVVPSNIPQTPRPAVSNDPAAAMRQRYNATLMRARKDQNDLGLREAQLMRQGGRLSADMQTARNGLAVEIQTVIGFMGRNDVAQANQHLQTIEDTLTAIEKYLGR